MNPEIEDDVCFACKAATDRRVVFGNVSPPVHLNVCAECDEDGTLQKEIERQFDALAAGPLKAVIEESSIAALAADLEALATESGWPFTICPKTGRKLYTK